MTRTLVTTGWDGVLQRVRAERDLQVLAPEVREAVMVGGSLVAAVVEDVCHRVADPNDRRWVAAVLAALSHQVQLSTMPAPGGN